MLFSEINSGDISVSNVVFVGTMISPVLLNISPITIPICMSLPFNLYSNECFGFDLKKAITRAKQRNIHQCFFKLIIKQECSPSQNVRIEVISQRVPNEASTAGIR
jgi:hypothetical protein